MLTFQRLSISVGCLIQYGPKSQYSLLKGSLNLRRFALENKNNTINSTAKYFDVIIVGAGPAGSTCAMALSGHGLKVAVIEKSTFPRDKVCGDAIGSRVRKVLNRIDPQLTIELERFEKKAYSRGWKLITPSKEEIKLNFVNHGYVSARIDFDNFLFQHAKMKSDISFFEDHYIKSVERKDDLVLCTTQSGELFQTKLIIGCDGAHSVVKKLSSDHFVDHKHYSGAVRAYYKNVSSIEKDIIEIHLSKNFLPGYFWIFPVSDTVSNVGFGMLSSDIIKRKIDLKKAIKEIIEEDETLSKRFLGAELLGEIKGFGLPLGGKKRKLSGDNFMLCGDAASLIDPLNGEGIGNAMLSGLKAGEIAIKAVKTSNFSSNFLSAYDNDINAKLLPELKQKLFFQKLFNRPWLINSLVYIGNRNKFLREWLGKKL
ncbi:MAG: geranylgeranyl reductase family protein [Bacteroidetes bacterium]|nr:geranylgeranyl reductase family protein [Bacteroidota bacterium]